MKTYRGVQYDNNPRTESQDATLTYRGKQYSKSARTCRKVDYAVVYRGIKHTEQRLVCA
jgi:hypothetical protein